MYIRIDSATGEGARIINTDQITDIEVYELGDHNPGNGHQHQETHARLHLTGEASREGGGAHVILLNGKEADQLVAALAPYTPAITS